MNKLTNLSLQIRSDAFDKTTTNKVAHRQRRRRRRYRCPASHSKPQKP